MEAQYLLDLTRMPSPRSSSVGGSGRIEVAVLPQRVIEGQQPTPLPLEVSVAGLDRNDYIIGSRMTYVVTIRNVGAADFTLPWSPTSEAEPDGSVTARIGLLLGGLDGRDHMLDAVTLTGHPDRKGTLCILKSGEVATIRIPGWVQMDPDRAKHAFTVEGNQLLFKVVFIFEAGGVWWETIRSEGKPANVRLPPSKQ